MKLENVFEVPVAPEEAWELFQDVPRVVPCLPAPSSPRPSTTITGKRP